MRHGRAALLRSFTAGARWLLPIATRPGRHTAAGAGARPNMCYPARFTIGPHGRQLTGECAVPTGSGPPTSRQGPPRLCSTSSGGRACSAQRRPAAARRVVGCEHAGDCLRRRRWWRCVQRLEVIARRVLPYTSFTHPHADVRAVRGCRDACGGWGQGCGCMRIQLPAGSQSELGLRWWLGAVCVVHCGGGKVCKAHQAAAFPLSLRAVCVQGAVCVRARVFSGRGP